MSVNTLQAWISLQYSVQWVFLLSWGRDPLSGPLVLTFIWCSWRGWTLCYSAKVWAGMDSYLRLWPQLLKTGLGSFLSPAPSWQASRSDRTPWNPLQGDMSWPAPPSLSFQFDVLPLCRNGMARGQEDSRTDCKCDGGTGVFGPVARTLSSPLSPDMEAGLVAAGP